MRLVTFKCRRETYCNGALADRRGIDGQAAVQTKRGGLEHLLERQAGVAVGDLVRVDVLRELAAKEEEGLPGAVDPEEAVTRTGAGVGGEWGGLNQRSNRVGSIGEDPDEISAQVWHEDICVRRVDDDLVRVAAVLARGDRPGLVDLWEDRLNGTGPGQSAVLTKLEDADRARVAGSCQRRFRGASFFLPRCTY